MKFRKTSWHSVRIVMPVLFCGVRLLSAQQDTGNTIDKRHFNFGHQLGYMYAQCEDAYFGTRRTWTFKTGFMAYYTAHMPLVRNPEYQERLMLLVPLHFEWHPSDNVTLRLELTDLFMEVLEYARTRDIHLMGGKATRFRTKIRVADEGRYVPSVAFTVGVTFSNAKPFTIWDRRHNYDQSNGLAGAGTGVADYLLLFAASKHLGGRLTLHGHLGIAPLGSPVEYERGSGQADEMPYGVTVDVRLTDRLLLRAAVAGMYNFLRGQCDLADYAVARANVLWHRGRIQIIGNVERGLTPESDDWVVGCYHVVILGRSQSVAETRSVRTP